MNLLLSFSSKGLLMKKPEDRMTWSEIIVNAFTKDHILIVASNRSKAFTTPMSDEEIRAKERQRGKILRRNQKREVAALSKLMCSPHNNKFQDVTTDDASSIDSVKNNVQTDLENFDTDMEELPRERENPAIKPPDLNNRIAPSNAINHDIHCNVKNNNNLVVMRYQDNFDMDLGGQIDSASSNSKKINSGSHNSDVPTTKKLETSTEKMVKSSEGNLSTSSVSKNKNRDLEKRKLSQDLENFAVRLGTSESSVTAAPSAMELSKEQLSIAE